MLKISRESEINLINVLIDNDVISGKDLINIKKTSTEGNKSQIEAVFDIKLTDEKSILDILVKEQSLDIVDLTGAGDLFASGYLHGYLNNFSQKDCLEKGTEMSSKIIQQIGARL